MGIISTLIFGLIAGIVAKMLMPGRDPGGCIITSLLGIVGAFVGKFISRLFGGPADFAAFTWSGFIMAVIGALVVLAIYRMFMGRRTLPPPGA